MCEVFSPARSATWPIVSRGSSSAVGDAISVSDLPIACTLTPDGMTARLAFTDALAADGLIDRTPTDTGLRVRLRDTPEIERRTRELIAAESMCCAFLDFNLRRDGAQLVLDIAGPQDARPVIDMFFAPDPA
jgi:hypothetical protein